MNWRACVRTLAGATLAGTALTAIAGGPVSGLAAPRVAVISLSGTGSWGSYQEMPAWRDALVGAPAGIDVEFAPHGSLIGRQTLLGGGADFALSGVPFSQKELQDAGSPDLIDAPIQVSTLGILTVPPPGGFVQLDQICDPNDPPPEFENDPSQCVVKTPYTGPVRMPADDLSAALFGYPGGGVPSLRSWSNPAVLASWGFQACMQTPLPPSGCALAQVLPNAGPGVVGRSDPDEIVYYMQQYAETASPAVWKTIGHYLNVKTDPITERLPILTGSTRDGVDQQALQLLLSHGADPVTGAVDFNTTAGGIAYVPPSALFALGKFSGGTGNLSFMQIQNANHDWVAPTPASIDAAVNAGGDTPLYALTHKVKDAYPLVWVEHLYAPAHGLSITKTEALAAMIRYIATAGQDVAAPVGEGKLPAALVTQSLQAADDLVRSNCVGSGRATYTSADPGPFAPDLPALHQIGPMLHCGVAATTTTTTTTPPTTTATTTPITVAPTLPFVAQGSARTPSGSDGASTPTSQPPAPTTTTPAGSKTTTTVRHVPAALSASSLPLPKPLSSSAGDDLATFLLGAGLFLLGRKPVQRLARLVVR